MTRETTRKELHRRKRLTGVASSWPTTLKNFYGYNFDGEGSVDAYIWDSNALVNLHDLHDASLIQSFTDYPGRHIILPEVMSELMQLYQGRPDSVFTRLDYRFIHAATAVFNSDDNCSIVGDLKTHHNYDDARFISYAIAHGGNCSSKKTIDDPISCTDTHICASASVLSLMQSESHSPSLDFLVVSDDEHVAATLNYLKNSTWAHMQPHIPYACSPEVSVGKLLAKQAKYVRIQSADELALEVRAESKYRSRR